MVRAFVGDSTITSERPLPDPAPALLPEGARLVTVLAVVFFAAVFRAAVFLVEPAIRV